MLAPPNNVAIRLFTISGASSLIVGTWKKSIREKEYKFSVKLQIQKNKFREITKGGKQLATAS